MDIGLQNSGDNGRDSVLKGTSGAAHVQLESGSVWSYGNWPNTLLLQAFAGTAANANDATIIAELEDASPYDHFEFSVVVAATSNGISVYVSHDGVTYEATPIMVVDRSVATGAAAGQISTISAIGNYYFDGKFKSIKIANNGATTSQVQIRGTAGVK